MGIGAGTLAWRDSMKQEFVGRRFTRLEVLAVDPSHEKGVIKYLCKCDCGKQISAYKANLSKGTTRSCGCLRAEESRKFAEATANEEYSKHRWAGRQRGHGFLNRQEWDLVVYLPCHYCGEMDTRNGCSRHAVRKERAKDLVAMWDLKINGVDRIDSSGPYKPENALPCCGLCNQMKNDSRYSEFLAKVEQIYANTRAR